MAAVIPGSETASMYTAVYDVSALIGSGPLSATRFPPVARHPTSAIVNSHICPRDSTTVPFGPFAPSAALRVR
jgi:hypothetical protein